MAGDRELWREEICEQGPCICDCERCPNREEIYELMEKEEEDG